MSTYGINVPSPDEINYHEALQLRRIDAARKVIGPGDVLAVIDNRIAAEADPQAHPLYHMVCWHLEKCLTPMDGGQFFDRFRQLVLQAMDTCLDGSATQGHCQINVLTFPALPLWGILAA